MHGKPYMKPRYTKNKSTYKNQSKQYQTNITFMKEKIIADIRQKQDQIEKLYTFFIAFDKPMDKYNMIQSDEYSTSYLLYTSKISSSKTLIISLETTNHKNNFSTKLSSYT